MQYFDQLRAYIGRNYTLTPLKPRSKEPIHKGWQARPSSLSEFDPNLNVGIVLGSASGNLVDVDLDHPDAITAAPYLLPSTGSIFGRASKPGSHRLYRTDEAGRTIHLKGSDGHMIVELRADRAQTLAPPSFIPTASGSSSRATMSRQPSPGRSSRGLQAHRSRGGARPPR